MGELRVGLEDLPLQKREVSELILHFLAIKIGHCLLGEMREERETISLWGMEVPSILWKWEKKGIAFCTNTMQIITRLISIF